MQLKNTIIVSILIIIALAGGYYLGATQIIPAPKFFQKEPSKELSTDQLAELERYKKAVEMMFPPAPAEIFAVNGIVKEVKENSVIIETVLLGGIVLPGEESKTEERKINIDENTKLMKISPYLSLMPEPGKEMPMPTEETFKLSDLKPGDNINAESSGNIKDEKEFTATKIIFYPAPENITNP